MTQHLRNYANAQVLPRKEFRSRSSVTPVADVLVPFGLLTIYFMSFFI